MLADPRALVEKIAALPPERRAEVEDFVDFLNARAGRAAALDRLLAIVPALEAAEVAPITEAAIRREVAAVRAERRARRRAAGS